VCLSIGGGTFSSRKNVPGEVVRTDMLLRVLQLIAIILIARHFGAALVVV
jgi:hypothetical protein